MTGGGRGDEAARGAMSGDERRSFAWRVGCVFAALFVIYGVHLPYLPVWLDWRGLSAAEISLVTAAPFFVRLVVTPAIAIYADQTDAHRRMVVVLGWCAAAAGLALALAPGFWSILAVAITFSIAVTSIMPLLETVAVAGVRSGGLDYGRMRLWGSLSFVVATVTGGLVIERLGAAAGVWMIAAGAVLTALASHLLPRPRAVAAAAATPLRMPRLDEAAELLRSPIFLAFLVAAGAIQGAHAAFYTFGALDWRSQGLSAGTIGALWMIGIAAEVALFAFSGAVMRHVWATTLLIAGAAAAVVRWSAMALDPPLAMLLGLQVLHGATYGAAHLGAIHFISRAVPERTAGTAQALYATVAAGIAMGLSTLLSGVLYEQLGGRGAYAGMAAIALVGLLAAVAVRRQWTGERLGGPADDPARPATLDALSPEQR